ncbi:NAD(P)/FAD-dependent oxidoreductase [Cryptosporangium sp. NPDC048952]|uniref:NAD(P)/FAD-dependent oxidoreductase n=1 Tax=Cryptosporangium sp. NPDC048952 TaxID=3363961 RepID=UPI0037236662
MKEVLVLGGGFAGVWSAASAVRAARDIGEPVRVTLVSAGDDLVIRPRLYQSDSDRMRVPLDRILGPVGVRRVPAIINRVDVAGKTVHAVDRVGEELLFPYDKMILAAGSQVVRPVIPGAEHLFDVDTLPSATALDQHLRRLPVGPDTPGRYTAVVVGAGFTGLEIATELGSRLESIAGPGVPVRVVLVDRAEVVGTALGNGPRAHIEQALAKLDVELRLRTTVEELSATEVRLATGEIIPTSTVVWTIGMLANPLTWHVPADRDRLGRLVVDDFMRVPGVPDVYAAGDTAAAAVDSDHTTLQSCQFAQPMGKCAGHNAVSDLFGRDPLKFAPDPYSNHLDLGPAGAVATTGFERDVVHAGEQAKAEKQTINTRFIYPPVDSAEALLARSGLLSNRKAASLT